MDIKDISLLPADPGRHFAAIADLLTLHETEPSTQPSLTEWYNRQLEDGIQFTVAVDIAGQVHGFSGIYRDNTNIERLYGVYLIVEPAYRRQGLGGMLYADLLLRAEHMGACAMRTRVRDNSERDLQFALHRGFVIKKHSIEMMFDLASWDEKRYLPLITSLAAQGFCFTDMAEQGDTQAARRKLYALNNGAAATDPGSDSIPPWSSFEEFEKDVCSAYWYHPDAQIIAIDTHTGVWAAMSAITVFRGADHAYNLFTGTDLRYRGRKLAQAVKSLALRKARQFGVNTVRTSHNSDNAAMIAIDTKLGYVCAPGAYILEKELHLA